MVRRPCLFRKYLIYITPAPALAWLDGADDWMVGFMEVLGRMFVLGGITASYVSAFQTQPQVDPGVSGLDAVFTDMLVSIGGFGFLNVSAVVHVFPYATS